MKDTPHPVDSNVPTLWRWRVNHLLVDSSTGAPREGDEGPNTRDWCAVVTVLGLVDASFLLAQGFKVRA